MMTRLGLALALLYAIVPFNCSRRRYDHLCRHRFIRSRSPSNPRKELSTEKGVNLVLYLVRDGDNIFASQEGFYPEIKDVQAEL